jgi:AcrR family transcriptional regulator
MREPVWARLAAHRKLRRPLSVERIVSAAMALTDREGLAAITIRRLAAELDASPMALYRHLASKDDVFDLLVDAAYAEITLPEHGSGEWRRDLGHAARTMRAAVNRHPWLVARLAEGPCLGPHALAHQEFCLAALDGLGLDISAMMSIVGMLSGYAINAAQFESAEAELNRRSGGSEHERQVAAGPYIERVVLASGQYPMLARWVREGEYADPDQLFELGLACLMDGVEVRLLRRLSVP